MGLDYKTLNNADNVVVQCSHRYGYDDHNVMVADGLM